MSRGNQGHKSGAAAISEVQFHRAVAGFLTLRLQPPDWFTTFPARWIAGRGGKLQGVALKRLGLKAGVPDIFPLVINGKVYGIELKAKGGRLSPGQIETRDALVRTGAIAGIAFCQPTSDNTLAELIVLLGFWGAKLRTVPPTLERLQLAIESWNEKSLSGTPNFPVDNFPISDQIGSRRSLSKGVSLKSPNAAAGYDRET